MYFLIRLLLLILSILLAYCQPPVENSTPNPTVIAPSPSPIVVPTFPSLEPLFHITPTLANVSQLLPINAENASSLRPFLGFTQDTIYDVAWSPDGKFILAATSHGLKLHSSFSLQEQSVNLSPFLAQSSVVAFSPTGTAMAWTETNSSGEWGLWLWNLVDGKKIAISIPNGGLAGVSFNSSGRLIAATIYDNGIQVWQMESGKMLASFSGAGDAQVVDFSPDGRLMASVGHADLMAHVWNVETGEEVGTIGKPNMYANTVEFSPIGNSLALGYQGSVQLWDVDTWREIGYLGSSNQRSVHDLVFSPKGDLLAVSVSFESMMFIVDSELKQVAQIENGGAVFSPDGESLAVTTDSGLKLFDTSTWEIRDSLPPRLGPVQQMIFRSDKQALVSIHEGSITVTWDLQTGAEISRISSRGKHFLSPDGKLLAVGTESGEVSVWNMDTGKLLKSYQHAGNVGTGDITFSQDNHLLTISYPDQAWNVVLWEWQTDQEPRVILLDEGLVYLGTLTPDGRKLAVQTWENQTSSNVGVWDTQTRALDWISKNSDASWISSVELHPNGEILTVGDRWIGTISLYETNSGTLLETLNEPDRLPDYDNPVNDIIFSHDGRHMVGIINGGPVIWNLENHAVINVERGCIRPIESIGFSPDDTLFMIAGEKNLYTDTEGGGVCIWETQTGKLLAGVGPADAYTSNFATFNPERTILAMDDNGTIWLWGVFQ